MTRDKVTQAEILVTVHGTTWVKTDEVTLGITGKTTLFEKDAAKATVEETVVMYHCSVELMSCWCLKVNHYERN